MLPFEAQELVRELITETDHLSRTWHEANEHTWAGRFAALRSTLQRLERSLGAESPRFAVNGELDLVYQRIRDLASRVDAAKEREDLQRLLSHAVRLRSRPPSAQRAALATPAAAPGRLQSVLLWSVAGGCAALLPLAVPGLRHSRAWWGIAAALASSSVGFAIAAGLRRRDRRAERTWLDAPIHSHA